MNGMYLSMLFAAITAVLGYFYVSWMDWQQSKDEEAERRARQTKAPPVGLQ